MKATYGWSAERMREAIERYFAELEADPGKRGGPNDLLAALQLDMKTAQRLVRASNTRRYREHAKLLRDAAVRLRAHLETSPAWAGSNASKSTYLEKSLLWDEPEGQEGGAEAGTVRVLFGGVEKAFE